MIYFPLLHNLLTNSELFNFYFLCIESVVEPVAAPELSLISVQRINGLNINVYKSETIFYIDAFLVLSD